MPAHRGRLLGISRIVSPIRSAEDTHCAQHQGDERGGGGYTVGGTGGKRDLVAAAQPSSLTLKVNGCSPPKTEASHAE
jgi:hypothetical protein